MKFQLIIHSFINHLANVIIKIIKRPQQQQQYFNYCHLHYCHKQQQQHGHHHHHNAVHCQRQVLIKRRI